MTAPSPADLEAAVRSLTARVTELEQRVREQAGQLERAAAMATWLEPRRRMLERWVEIQDRGQND